MVLLIVHVYRCKFLLQAIHIYRTCFPYNEDVLREKQVFHQFLFKSYNCFLGQANVSTLRYHCCQPHVAKLYQKTPLCFNNYCRQKIIFYHSSALIQLEAQISDYRS